MCGAVNTIVNDNGKLIGHITDGIGYMQSLKDNNIDVIGKKMTIAGAGGAAKAIEVQAALDGVKEISIFNIKDKFWEAAEKTVDTIRSKTDCIVNLYDLDDKEKLREEIADSYLFAQATGVGMKPLEGQSVIPGPDRDRYDLCPERDSDTEDGERGRMQDDERSRNDALPGRCSVLSVDRKAHADRPYERST